jgi:hypothetical protein
MENWLSRLNFIFFYDFDWLAANNLQSKTNFDRLANLIHNGLIFIEYKQGKYIGKQIL